MKTNEQDSAKQILRQHLHGLSDEQFEYELNKYPLCEVLFAMERYAKIKINEINYENTVS